MRDNDGARACTIHIHGFATGDKAATCASAAQDKNGDGVIDLAETEPVSGTTRIPFADQPAGLKIPSDKYPVANAQGDFTYKQTVSLKQLNATLKRTSPSMARSAPSA